MAVKERTRPAEGAGILNQRQVELRDRFSAVGLSISGQQGPIPTEFAKFAHQFSIIIGGAQTVTGEGISNAFNAALATIQPTLLSPVNFRRVAEIREHFGTYASEVTPDLVIVSEAIVHHEESVAKQKRFLEAMGGPPFDF